MPIKKKFKVKYKKFTLETNSLKCHYHNVRVVAAMKYAKKHSFDEAADKFDYSSSDSLRKAAMNKLGVHYPFAKKIKITDDNIKQAIEMRKTMTVKLIADHFGVSQTHMGKKISDAKQNSNCDKLLQQLLCSKL